MIVDEITSSEVLNEAVAPQRLRWTPELVQRFWDGFSQTPLVSYSFSKQAGKGLITAIDHLLPEGGVILDYGAGDGELVKLLCERGLHAAAFEPSPERRAKLSLLLENCPGFLGVEHENTSKQFDVVIMAEVIEHILDEQFDQVLTQLSRLVRPGGMLVVTTPNNEDLDLGMTYCPVSNLLFHRWQHVRSFTDRSLSETLGRHGFEEVVTHRLDLSNNLYAPFDRVWGASAKTSARSTRGSGLKNPSYIRSLRANQPTNIGSETNILFIGRRKCPTS